MKAVYVVIGVVVVLLISMVGCCGASMLLVKSEAESVPVEIEIDQSEPDKIEMKIHGEAEGNHRIEIGE